MGDTQVQLSSKLVKSTAMVKAINEKEVKQMHFTLEMSRELTVSRFFPSPSLETMLQETN